MQAPGSLDGGIVAVGVDHRAVADDVVGDDQAAGTGQLERPGEVVGRVLLVGVDEDQIERLAALGGELREASRAPPPRAARRHRRGRLERRWRARPRRTRGWPRASPGDRSSGAPAPARWCCSRRACPARGSCALPIVRASRLSSLPWGGETAMAGRPAAALASTAASSAGSASTSLSDDVAVDRGPPIGAHGFRPPPAGRPQQGLTGGAPWRGGEAA